MSVNVKYPTAELVGPIKPLRPGFNGIYFCYISMCAL